MFGSIASAIVRITGDDSSLQTSLRRSQQSLLGLRQSLSQIGIVAAGILLARLFEEAAEAAARFLGMAVRVTGEMQTLQLRLQSLAARELANFTNATIDNVKEWVSASDVFDQAKDTARGLFDELTRMAVLSPYSIRAAADVMNLFLAFQWGSKQALAMTEGILNLAAGIGATRPQLERITFNFAQLRMQGKIMARDFWELGKSGFDLMAVLQELARQTGYNISTHMRFNELLAAGKVTWEDFMKAFVTLAKRDFGEAAKRFAFTVEGIKNTFEDLRYVIIPRILGPAADLIGEWAEKATMKLLDLVESGKLDEIGEKLRDYVEGWVDAIYETWNAIRWYGLFEGLAKAMQRLGVIPTEDLAYALRRLGKSLDGLFGSLLDIGGLILSLIIPDFEGWGDAMRSQDLPGKIDRITESINDLNDYLSRNKEKIAAAITDFLKFAGTILGISSVLKILSVLIGAFQLLGGPLLLLVALGGLLYAAWQTDFMGIRETVTSAMETAKEKLIDFANTMRTEAETPSTWQNNLLTTFDDVKNRLPETLESIKDMLTSVWSFIAETVGPEIQPIAEHLGWLVTALRNFFADLQSMDLGGYFEELRGVLSRVLPAIGGIFKWLFRIIVPIVAGIVDGIITGFAFALPHLSGIIEGFSTAVEGFLGLFSGIWDLIKAILSGDSEAVGEAWEKIKESGAKIVEGIKRVFSEGLKLVGSFLVGFFVAFFTHVRRIAATLYENIKEAVQKAIRGVLTIGTEAIKAAKEAINRVATKITTTIREWAAEQADKIREAFDISKWKTVGQDVMQGLKDGLKKGWTSIVTWVKKKFSWLTDLVGNIFDSHSPSKAFAKIGKDVVLGFGQGLAKTLPRTFNKFADQTLSEMKKFSDAIALPLPQPAYAPAYATAGFAPKTSAGERVVEKVYYNNLTVYSQAQVEDLVADFTLLMDWSTR